MNEWISVDDRLPEVGRAKSADLKWLAFDGERIEIVSAHPAWWNEPGEECPIDGCGCDHGGGPVVTHWMPLPEPPTKEMEID